MDKFSVGILCFVIGMVLIFFIGITVETTLYGWGFEQRILPQEVINDICFQLTENSTVVGLVEDGKLVCELPSYDSTQNIIVKMNNGGGE